MSSPEEILEQAEKVIPAEVHMISGCRDEQTSADVSNVASFSLPDPAGRAGGACTAAMLKVLYADEQTPSEDLSFQQVLLQMRDILSQGRFTQIPQLTSSRPMDITKKFDLVPDDFEGGTKRAVMVGINYVGQQGELRGCHNDVGNMLNYIKNVHGFEDDNITLLMDDGNHAEPTRENMLAAYKQIVADSQPGDVVFCHYSGHGGKLRDDDGDEKDGYDETLVPLDYASSGQIRDDDLFKVLIGPMSKGVFMTCVMDCCHSGTVLDLPYQFVADGEQEGMQPVPDFDFSVLMGLFQNFMQSQGGGISEDALQAAMRACGCFVL